MKVSFYQIDAFTGIIFRGNPAGVCMLDSRLPDETMQAIAAENNLAETAFLVKSTTTYELRWFTPEIEIDLCGHATLASAFVIFNFYEPELDRIDFETRSGLLSVEKTGARLAMNFPARPASPCDIPAALTEGLGERPLEVRCARDYLAVFESEAVIHTMKPDIMRLAALECVGIIATAPGSSCDFVSRFFAPRVGVPEDPVTGSSHCTLIPYWSERLGKKELHARQLSKRGGELFCRDQGERVSIAGEAVLYLKGTIVL